MTTTTTGQRHLTIFLYKNNICILSEANAESSENQRPKEINELSPTLVTIIARLEKEKSDKIASIRQHLQNIEVEKIDIIDSPEY